MRKKTLFEETRIALTLGLRALILKDLNPKNKEKFEKILLKKGDDELFLFGQAHTTSFNNRFIHLTDEISEALVKNLE